MKIYDFGLNENNGWETPPELLKLTEAGYDAIYMQASSNTKDNIYITDFYNKVMAWNKLSKVDKRMKPLKLGFFIKLVDGSNSYTRQIQDLVYKYNKPDLELPPAVIFEGSLRTGHSVRGDLEFYLESEYINKFPVVVFGVSKTSISKLLEPWTGDDINQFCTKLTKMKLWYFRWGIEKPEAKEYYPWTSIYIRGVDRKYNVTSEEIQEPEPTPEVQPLEELKNEIKTLDAIVTQLQISLANLKRIL